MIKHLEEPGNAGALASNPTAAEELRALLPEAGTVKGFRGGPVTHRDSSGGIPSPQITYFVGGHMLSLMKIDCD